MKRHITFFTAIILLLFVLPLSAQEPPQKEPYRTWIMGMPQYIFTNGMRLEVDRALKNPDQWLTFGATIYYRGQEGSWLSYNSNLLSMGGFALDAFYRWYPFGLKDDGGFYLSAGGGYRYVEQNFFGNTWISFEESGLTYYETRRVPWDRITQSVSVRATIGYQVIWNDYFGMDFFIGPGVKLSHRKEPEWVDSGDTDIYGFGGNGVLTVMGVRIGVGW